jgi:thioredoxin-like negative regulator of GroEL
MQTEAAEMSPTAMTQPLPGNEATPKPSLLFFFDPRSGRSRRADGYLAQVLQRRQNHDTFRIYRIDVTDHGDLAVKFAIETVPTFVVVDNNRVKARLEEPHGCKQLTEFLEPWLR